MVTKTLPLSVSTVGLILATLYNTSSSQPCNDHCDEAVTNLGNSPVNQHQGWFGNSVDLEAEWEINLSRTVEGDVDEEARLLEQELTVSVEYLVNERLQIVSDIEAFFDKEYFNSLSDSSPADAGLELTDLYLSWDSADGDHEYTLGKREYPDDDWWLGDGTELLLVTAAYGLHTTELGFDISSSADADQNYRWFARQRIDWNDDHRSSFLVVGEGEEEEFDDDQIASDSYWVGFSASGEIEWFSYELNVARNLGSRVVEDESSASNIDVGAWAFDAEIAFDIDILPYPTLTIGYATSSQDNDDETIDSQFQAGAYQSFDYGSMFDPDLSNLTIFSIGVDIPLRFADDSMSLELYKYTLLSPSFEFDDDLAEFSRTDSSSDIGTGIDIDLPVWKFGDFSSSLSFSWFKPGSAAIERATSHEVMFELTAEI